MKYPYDKSLTNSSAGKNFPIYTTYAAGKQRSAFTLDEGYELLYEWIL